MGFPRRSVRSNRTKKAANRRLTFIQRTIKHISRVRLYFKGGKPFLKIKSSLRIHYYKVYSYLYWNFFAYVTHDRRVIMFLDYIYEKKYFFESKVLQLLTWIDVNIILPLEIHIFRPIVVFLTPVILYIIKVLVYLASWYYLAYSFILYYIVYPSGYVKYPSRLDFYKTTIDPELIGFNVVFSNRRHRWHILPPSINPIFTSVTIFFVFYALIKLFNNHDTNLHSARWLLLITILMLVVAMDMWFRDISVENVLGYHTTVVRKTLRIGFYLFLTTEVMFFIGFFWAFFHFGLSPSVLGSGTHWPPEGISYVCFNGPVGTEKYDYYTIDYNNNAIVSYVNSITGGYFMDNYNISLKIVSKGVLANPYKLPFVNTILLLSSGLTVTISHVHLKLRQYGRSIFFLVLTIIYALIFLKIQFNEYLYSKFTIADSTYGSLFYILTGFHGLHVIIGTLFLIICFFRLITFQYSRRSHWSFSAAIWYWHFVDAVWVVLYLSVYCWCNCYYYGRRSIRFRPADYTAMNPRYNYDKNLPVMELRIYSSYIEYIENRLLLSNFKIKKFDNLKSNPYYNVKVSSVDQLSHNFFVEDLHAVYSLNFSSPIFI